MQLFIDFLLDEGQPFFCFLGNILHFLLSFRSNLGLGCEGLQFLDLKLCLLYFRHEFSCLTLCFESLDLILANILLCLFCCLLNRFQTDLGNWLLVLLLLFFGDNSWICFCLFLLFQFLCELLVFFNHLSLFNINLVSGVDLFHNLF